MKRRHIYRNKRYRLLGGTIIVFILVLFSIRGIVLKHKENPIPRSTNLGATPIGSVGFTDTQISALVQLYNTEHDKAVAQTLLDLYISQYSFDSGYMLLDRIAEEGKTSDVKATSAAYLLYNYAVAHGQKWDARRDSQRGFSQSIKDIRALLEALASKDYAKYDMLLQNIHPSSTGYASLVSALLDAKTTYTTLTAPPAYYYTGLISATLMEAGYLPLATNLAKDVLKQDASYILSYEVLSQSALKQHHYEDAITYLHTLYDLDSQHLSRTAFFLGVAYYWAGDYVQAGVYFNQVRDLTYLDDTIRYLILIAHQQKDTETMMNWFRYLLSENKVHENDFTLLFDIAFYQPYMHGGATGDFSLSHDYALKVIIPYIDACRKKYGSSKPFVCKYGEAGRYLAQKTPEKALQNLLYLTQTYPHPIVYQALGDYYAHNGDQQKAQTYYMKAVMARADSISTTSQEMIFSGNKQGK